MHLDAIGVDLCKDERILLLEFVEHLGTVLGLEKSARKTCNGLKDLVLQGRVSENRDGFLKDVVSELVGSQALNDVRHALSLIA